MALEELWGRGVPTLHSWKSTCNIWLPQNLTSCPLVSVGWLVPEPPTSTQTQVPYIKWCRSMHTLNPLHSRIPNCWSKILFSIHGCLTLQMRYLRVGRANCIFIEKNLHKWTCAVQTHAVQGSTIFSYPPKKRNHLTRTSIKQCNIYFNTQWHPFITSWYFTCD